MVLLTLNIKRFFISSFYSFITNADLPPAAGTCFVRRHNYYLKIKCTAKGLVTSTVYTPAVQIGLTIGRRYKSSVDVKGNFDMSSRCGRYFNPVSIIKLLIIH